MKKSVKTIILSVFFLNVAAFLAGLIPCPFSGLRLFSGVIAGGIGLFLFFTWLDRRKKT